MRSMTSIRPAALPRALARPLALAAIPALALTSPLAAQGADATPAPATPAWAARVDSAIAAELKRTNTPGAQLAVVVDGRLAYTKGFGVADLETGRAVTDRTLFRVGSVTKMVTSAALAQMAADGALDLQAPIGKYVPEIAGKKVGTVTTHQLLTHSAGWIDNATPYGRMGEGALGEVMREVNDSLFFTEPGRILSYSNPGYSMAGYVAEQAGKARFADLVDKFVVKRMGMPRATFRPLSALTHDFSQGHIAAGAGAPAVVRPFTENTAQWAAGFLFASAAELSRFTIALMEGGTLDGQRVLAADVVRRLTTGHVAVPGDSVARYGYGLVITRRGTERIWTHGGSINGFDATVVMFPDRKLSVVLIDNRSGAPLTGIVDLVAKEVAGIAPPAPPTAPTEVTPDAAARATIVGRFAQGPTRVEIAEDAGKLVFKQGPVTLPLKVMSDDRIQVQLPNGGTQGLLLVRGADGRVEFLHQGLRSLARQP